MSGTDTVGGRNTIQNTKSGTADCIYIYIYTRFACLLTLLFMYYLFVFLFYYSFDVFFPCWLYAVLTILYVCLGFIGFMRCFRYIYIYIYVFLYCFIFYCVFDVFIIFLYCTPLDELSFQWVVPHRQCGGCIIFVCPTPHSSSLFLLCFLSSGSSPRFL